MNIAVQLFVFEPTRRAVLILNGLAMLLKDFPKAKIVWTEHDGNRRTATIKNILNGEDRLNEAYIQTPLREIHDDLVGLGVQEAIVHLSISPTSEIWDPSSVLAPSGKPSIRRVISYVQSLERASAFRKPEPMPTVLEITLKCAQGDSQAILEAVCQYVEQTWPEIDCAEKFATVDFGEEWLFFPKSGYNPNVSDIHVYYSTEVRKGWNEWRERHNVSFSATGKDQTKPQKTIHSLLPQIPSTHY